MKTNAPAFLESTINKNIEEKILKIENSLRENSYRCHETFLYHLPFTFTENLIHFQIKKKLYLRGVMQSNCVQTPDSSFMIPENLALALLNTLHSDL